MFKMQKLNVVRLVATEEEKAALENQAFEEVAEVSPDYDNMTVDDLKILVKDKGITGYSNMKKDELIAILKADSKESEEK